MKNCAMKSKLLDEVKSKFPVTKDLICWLYFWSGSLHEPCLYEAVEDILEHSWLLGLPYNTLIFATCPGICKHDWQVS